jgi:hypothetical protein
MAASEPGEPRDPRSRGSGRVLDEPPSARYTRAGLPGDGRADGRGDGESPIRPLAEAGIVAAVGAALLFLVGAIVASTAGLVFVSGVMGAAIGLLLSQATVSDVGTPALTRRAATWLAIAIAIAAVVVAAIATWLYARGEGGTLGPLDYLLQTFGPFVPGELLIATLGAAWGASSGPVRRS